MMFKNIFVSKRTLKKNNDILFKRNTDLNKMCIYLQQGLKERNDEIQKLKDINSGLENSLVATTEILDDKRKEIKRLKTLLTKNNIQYRKEN